MRPVIGISAYCEQAKWLVWDVPTVLLTRTYSDRVAEAGGLPLLVPPGEPGTAAAYVARLDGLVLSGGGDVDPARYGDARHPRTGRVDPVRDAMELRLAEEALRQEVPLLGICRGLQILNVLLGGTLQQHLPETPACAADPGMHTPEPGTFGRHEVEVVEGSRLAGVFGRTRLDVATAHHQAVDRLGEGLVVSGRAPDGVVEAVEMPGQGFTLAVQWHPEQDAGADGSGPLFEALVEAARMRAAQPVG